MNQDMKIKLRSLLIKHEGYRTKIYKDSFGNITGGIGRNLSARDFFPDEIELMYVNDVDHFFNFLYQKFPWFSKLNDARQCALVDMCFMGTKTFLEFKDMIAAFEKNDFDSAAREIINSKYETEVHQRAHNLAEIIRTGVL